MKSIQQSFPVQLRVILCARVSRDEQNRPGMASIETQINDMRDEAEKRGWKIVYVAEEDCSGWIEFRERPEGGVIMGMLERGEADILMLWDNDRLGRDVDTVVAKTARRDFRKLGVQVFSLHQPVEIKPREFYDPYKEDSTLWLENFSDTASSVAIRQLIRRHDMGMRKRIKNGRITGTPPIGYKVIMVNDPPGSVTYRQKRVEDEVYSPIIKKIFNNYEQGASFFDIARELNIIGIKTPPRFSKKADILPNGGKLWTATTIKGIINNPVYYGASVYGKDKSISVWDAVNKKFKTIKKHQPMEKWLIVENGEHPALVTKEQSLRCQEIKKSKASYGRTYGESYLLSGLCKCGHCMYSMHRSGGWGGGYIECDRHLRTGKTQCQTNSHRIIHLEKHVLDYICQLNKKPHILANLKIRRAKKQHKNLAEELRVLQSKLEEAVEIKDQIHEFMETKIYKPEVGNQRLLQQEVKMGNYLSRIEEIKKKMQELSNKQRVSETVSQVLLNFEERFKKLPLKHQKIMLRSLIKEIQLYTYKDTGLKKVKIIFNLD